MRASLYNAVGMDAVNALIDFMKDFAAPQGLSGDMPDDDGFRQRARTQVRAEIDAIDLQLQALLNRRAACAQQVAEVKKAEAARRTATRSRGR